MNRDERQEEGRLKWIRNKCKGTLEYCTGFGKTTTAIKCIKSVLAKYPNFRILVVVPTDALKKQWITALTKNQIIMAVEVVIVNSAVKHTWTCDILLIDEIHRMAAETFKGIFTKVTYKLILGLTATLKRLDEKHKIIEEYCPVVDSISIEEATQNYWLSPYKEFKVYLDVDLEEYQKLDREFNDHFAFFEYDFSVAMKMVGPKGHIYRAKYAKILYTGNDKDQKQRVKTEILGHAMGFMKCMQKRKEFIHNHPKKIEITNLILEHRKDKKAITFSPTIKVAEKIGYGCTFHSGQTKKKNAMTMEQFIPLEKGVLNTSKALNEGIDIPGLNLAIILSNSSSQTEKTQRIGRAIRYSVNKEAEIFTLVIRGTVEDEWFNKSSANKKYTTINEEELLNVLTGQDYREVKSKPVPYLFRL